MARKTIEKDEMFILRSFLCAILLTSAACTSLAPGGRPGAPTVRVVDGDTLVVAGERVRLHGIDAPEMRQTCDRARGEAWACGTWARDQLRALTMGRIVDCEVLDRDRYGRAVARCWAHEGVEAVETVANSGRAGASPRSSRGGAGLRALGSGLVVEEPGTAQPPRIELNRAMVTRGAAVAYRRYSRAYVGAEARARASQRGVWALGGRGFVDPAQYRRERRGPEQIAPDPACVIKGNISRAGRIFHQPGQRDYARTRINLSQGERWFCTSAQARAAGWRAARN